MKHKPGGGSRSGRYYFLSLLRSLSGLKRPHGLRRGLTSSAAPRLFNAFSDVVFTFGFYLFFCPGAGFGWSFQFVLQLLFADFV